MSEQWPYDPKKKAERQGHKHGDIITYTHHGETMAVRAKLKGTHREHCLCYSCGVFKPGQADNCTTAQTLFTVCQALGLVTPVFECRNYADGPADLSDMEGYRFRCGGCGADVTLDTRPPEYASCPACGSENRLLP